jgi:hypothetical protein
LNILTIGRLLAVARKHANDISSSSYIPKKRLPENDPDYILSYLGKVLLPDSWESDKLITDEINIIFPELRD